MSTLMGTPGQIQSWLGKFLLVTLFALTCLLPGQAMAGTQLQITVDATELPRKLLHSKISLNTVGDTVSLLYPKWIPAWHGPVGPIENVVGLSVTDAEGETVRWERDYTEYYRFFIYPMDKSNQSTVSLSFICNQGGSTCGFSSMGIIDWQTVALYPEGIPVDEIKVDLKLVLPKGWQYGSALPYQEIRGDTIVFRTITFEEFIDMPLICGSDFRTVEIAVTKKATYYIHMAANHPDDLPEIDDDTIFVRFKQMMLEAESLFARTHFDEYHFLLSLSDSAGGGGLEHRNSSLNKVKSKAMHESSWYESGVPSLLAHEMVHAWCGKYRRPAGMATKDYLTPKNQDLLWVYEGLTTYLGWLLASRAGFWDFENAKDQLAFDIAYLLRQKGRRWQPLRDVQIATYLFWGSSQNWRFHKRGADYYDEGALLWLEIDARIRTATDGKKSLDDFCGLFFGQGDPSAHYIPFRLDDVVSTLNELADGPFDSLFDARLNHTQSEYDTTSIHWSGYRLGYTDERSEPIEKHEKRREHHVLYESIGLSIKDDGTVVAVVPNSPADEAGLYAGVSVIGINDKRYTFDRLENAVYNAGKKSIIRLLTLHDENFVEVVVRYDGGLRFFSLEPIENRHDWIKEITNSRVNEP
jgi:predicted metalloprotease with PDZ domain